MSGFAQRIFGWLANEVLINRLANRYAAVARSGDVPRGGAGLPDPCEPRPGSVRRSQSFQKFAVRTDDALRQMASKSKEAGARVGENAAGQGT